MKDLNDYIWDIYCEAFEEDTCTKFCGSFTAEEIRKRLRSSGLPISQQDVFIRNVPIEIDLLIPRPGAKPKFHNLVYEPEDVLAVLEIKYRGTFSADGIKRIRENFDTIRQANKNILCAYLTVKETLGYKNAVTTQKLGYPAYTLFWWSKGSYKQTKDWQKLIKHLRGKVAISRRKH